MSLDAIARAIDRYAELRGTPDPYPTELPGVILLRSTAAAHGTRALLQLPALCLVIQGAKRTSFGARELTYRAGEALLVNLPTPGISRVAEGGPDGMYRSVAIDLDVAIMRDVFEIVELADRPHRDRDRAAGTLVVPIAGAIADCVLRALQLLETPEAIPVLYPGIMRELCYRLLTSDVGPDIASAMLGVRREDRLVHVVQLLRERFAETFAIEELAEMAQLGPSAFHRKFKALMGLTPIQYQKQLRLLEARRLMIVEGSSAEQAAYRVGYESTSQFSREYARMFGQPPRRDAEQTRVAAAVGASDWIRVGSV